jgi:hypothetical protein
VKAVTASAAGTFAAVGDSGEIIFSRDARTWQQVTSEPREYLLSAAYADGRFVAVGGSPYYIGGPVGSAAVLTSLDGYHWRAALTNLEDQLSDVAFGNGLWVVTGDNGGIFTSADGFAWTDHTLPTTSHDLTHLVYGRGRFIAFAESRDLIYFSCNGQNWATREALGVSGVEKARFLNDRFMAVGDGGLLLVSQDGLRWDRRALPTTVSLCGIAYGRGRYVAGGSSILLYSLDGVTWQAQPAPMTVYDVEYVNGWFVALGNDSQVLVSADGIHWGSGAVPAGMDWVTAAASGKGALVALAGINLYHGTISSSNAPNGGSPICTINVAASPPGSGQVSGGGVFRTGGFRTVKATAKSGFILANWMENGAVVSQSPTFTFQANDNWNLVANFIPNPFVATKGTYSGLCFDTNGVTPESTGRFTLTTTAKGGFTGSLWIAGKRLGLSGSFEPDGTSTQWLSLGNTSLLEMHIQLDLSASAGGIIGTLSDGIWSTTLFGQKAGFDGRSIQAPQAGRYTWFVAGTNASASAPVGDSYGTLVVDRAGRIQWAGLLADGTKVTQTALLSQTGQWPLCAALYRGRGFIMGWLAIGASMTNDLTGDLIWMRPSIGSASSWPDGFIVDQTASGFRYVPPTMGSNVLALSSAVVLLTGGGLEQNLTNRFSMKTHNRILDSSLNDLKLCFSPSTGLFRGSVLLPNSAKILPFSGAVFQSQNIGCGFFLHAGQSGKVLLANTE